MALGSSGALFGAHGPSWSDLGGSGNGSEGDPGELSGSEGRSWEALGGVLGLSWVALGGRLGRSWRGFKAHLGHLVSLFGCCWRSWGAKRAFEKKWFWCGRGHDFGDLEAFLAALGSTFGGLGWLFDGSWGLLGSFGLIVVAQGSDLKAILAILGALRTALGRLLGAS